MNVTTAHAAKAATWITRIAYTIAIIGVTASYGTQVALLQAHHVGAFAWVIPSTIDLLAIASTMALQLPNLDQTSRRIAGGILLASVAVSVTANVAGGHSVVERAAHAWPVLAYLAGELLANRVRAYAARLHAAEAPTAAAPQITAADVQAAVDAAIAQTLAQAATATQAAIATAVTEALAADAASRAKAAQAAKRRERAAQKRAEEIRPVSPATIAAIDAIVPAETEYRLNAIYA